jgi:hypothetical protein
MVVTWLHYLTAPDNRTNWQRNRVSHMHAIRHHSLDVFLHSRRIHRHSEPVWMGWKKRRQEENLRANETEYRYRQYPNNPQSPAPEIELSNKARDLHPIKKKEQIQKSPEKKKPPSYMFTTPIHATTTAHPLPSRKPSRRQIHTHPPVSPHPLPSIHPPSHSPVRVQNTPEPRANRATPAGSPRSPFAVGRTPAEAPSPQCGCASPQRARTDGYVLCCAVCWGLRDGDRRTGVPGLDWFGQGRDEGIAREWYI